MHQQSGSTVAVVRARRAQVEASDPQASVWVAANAGTGKTHVLTMRVLRCLLAGARLDRIVCLTYTKAAAAEMATRLYGELAGWVTEGEAALAHRLEALLGRPATLAEAERARTLFAEVLEAPGGLRIETIHAFAERVLRRCPLEAGVPPGFTVLDEQEAQSLLREAIDTALDAASANPTGRLARAVRRLVRHTADHGFNELVAAALAEADWREAMLRYDDGRGDEAWAAAGRFYRKALGIRVDITAEALDSEIIACLDETILKRLKEALALGPANDQKASAKIAAALSARSADSRIRALEAFFCTDKGEPRQSLVTATIKQAHPGLGACLPTAQKRFCALLEERKTLEVIEATLALLAVSEAAADTFATLKSRRIALDFNDLVRKAAALLEPSPYGRREPLTGWVLSKLDGGFDHILVDESQDTSPAQWRIVEALSRDFLDGEDRPGVLRSLFAVGDEKQSIFSFQGAAPEMFAAQGAILADCARAAKHPWRSVTLDVSFRSAMPILEATDRVFADPLRTPGLSAETAWINHVPYRTGAAGLIEIWPTETYAKTAEADPWSPLDETSVTPPSVRLAIRISALIRRWLDGGERLVSENRPIRPGDILILVRKRNPFAAPMVAALEAVGVPVAGADRLMLAQEIVVQDLLALAQVLTLPGDDLSLAAVLKSPLFGFDDDDLLRLAHGRPGTLMEALAHHGTTNARAAAAHAALMTWSNSAAVEPPYELFAGILDRDGMRSRFLERIGGDVRDPLDAFMSAALAYGDRAPPSLAGFLHRMLTDGRNIKRDMEQGGDEVRVMTVHGAKGLEAPIVFLADTCTVRGAGRGGGLLRLMGLKRPMGMPEPFVYALKGATKLKGLEPFSEARKRRDARERNRLLYVAMTRARDRLYVAGFETKRGRESGCWYDLVIDGLSGSLHQVTTEDGQTAWRRTVPQTGPVESRRFEAATVAPETRPPPWLSAPPPDAPAQPRSIAPSGLAAEDEVPGVHASGRPARTLGRLRGVLTHALLEYLPDVPRERRAAAAERFVECRGKALDPATRESIVRETLRIIDDPVFAPLFGPGSRAEVPIAGRIARAGSYALPLEIRGSIDRLAVTGGTVLVVDYKTGRAAPASVRDAPPAYLLQLAAYRLVLARVFPDQTIRAALLWTETPSLMEVHGSLLDDYAERLWQAQDPALTLT